MTRYLRQWHRSLRTFASRAFRTAQSTPPALSQKLQYNKESKIHQARFKLPSASDQNPFLEQRQKSRSGSTSLGRSRERRRNQQAAADLIQPQIIVQIINVVCIDPSKSSTMPLAARRRRSSSEAQRVLTRRTLRQ